MSNLTDWIGWAVSQDAAATLAPLAEALPLLATIQVAPPAPVSSEHDAPDANGLVNIPLLADWYGTDRWACEEIEPLLTDPLAQHTVSINVQNGRFVYNNWRGVYDFVMQAGLNTATGGYALTGVQIPHAHTSRFKTIADTIGWYTAIKKGVPPPADLV